MIIPKKIQEHIRLLRMDGGQECEKFLIELGNYAVEQGLAKEGFTEALLEREKKYPTGIQAETGIAIPHSEQEYTIKQGVLIVLLDKPVEFRPMGGGEAVSVETVFLLLLARMEHQVEMLQHIVAFIQDGRRMERLREKEVSEDVLSSFEEFF